jgi:hypothetical protein
MPILIDVMYILSSNLVETSLVLDRAWERLNPLNHADPVDRDPAKRNHKKLWDHGQRIKYIYGVDMAGSPSSPTFILSYNHHTIIIQSSYNHHTIVTSDFPSDGLVRGLSGGPLRKP